MNGDFTHTRKSRGKSLFVQIVGQLNGHRVEVEVGYFFKQVVKNSFYEGKLVVAGERKRGKR